MARINKRNRFLLTITAVLAVVVLINVAPKAFANIPPDYTLRTIQEWRVGSTITEPDSTKVEWQGTRSIANPFDALLAPIRRALEGTVGLDMGGSGRADKMPNTTVGGWAEGNVTQEELDFYRFIALPQMFLMNNTTKGESLTQTADKLSKATESSSDFSLANLMEMALDPSKNPMGRELLIRAELLETRGLAEKSAVLAAQTGNLPKFKNEEQYGANNGMSSTTASPDPTVNTITISADEMGRKADSTYQQQLVAAIAPGSFSQNARTNPAVALPAINETPDTLDEYASVDNPGLNNRPLGELAKRNGTQLRSGPTYDEVALEPFMRQATSSIANSLNNLVAARGRANSFFGGAGPTQNELFGQNGFNNAVNNLFGNSGGSLGGGGGSSGGGGLPNSLQDIQTQDNPPQGTCANTTPSVSLEEAKGAAVIMGLPMPNQNSKWQSAYLEASALYGITGYVPGGTRTIGSQDFPTANQCVWVISNTDSATEVFAAMIEDIRSTVGKKLYIRIPRS